MLVMESTRRLAISLLLMIIAASPTAAATGTREAPGQPGNLTVSPRSGHIFWGQPENMVEEVPLSYSLVVQDLADDSHTVTYENVTKQRIKIDIPECYSIELYASNEAGTSAPSILSSPPCSPTNETSAESSASTSLSRTSGLFNLAWIVAALLHTDCIP